MKLRYWTLTASHSLGISDKKIKAILDLKFPDDASALAKHYSDARNYYLHGNLPNFPKRLERIRNKKFEEQNREIKNIIMWSFWTLNHNDFHHVNDLVKGFIATLPKSEDESNRRYLPEHTSNMGHLAMLFLYINYYRKRDPDRIIVLPKSKVANEYFLKLIIQHSPLEIQFAEIEEFQKISPTQLDTLHYSLEKDNTYRSESDVAFYSKQEHPEFKVDRSFILKLSEVEQQKGEDILLNFLGYLPEFIVILHVREPKNRDLTFSQARDTNITKFRKVAQEIASKGGLVVRMGDCNFPKLPRKFPAFDYAHSIISSDFMDVWLWANCKTWIGNVNGAAFAPIAFNKRRLLVDQWYWNLLGPQSDKVIRKRIVSRQNNSNISDVYDLKISRCMDRAFISRLNFKIIESSSDEILKNYSLDTQDYESEFIQMSPDAYVK